MASENSQGSFLGRLFGGGRPGEDQLARMVRNALIVFTILAIVYLIASLTILNTAAKQFRTGALTIAVKDLNLDMLQMRRNEKDFYIRRNKQYFETHAENYKLAQANLQAAIDSPEVNAAEKALLEGDIRKELTEYRENFVKSAQGRIDLGLDDETGTLGQIRAVGIAMTEEFTRLGAKDALLALSFLRITFRDYVIASESQAAEQGQQLIAKFDENYKAFVDAINMSKLEPAAHAKAMDYAKQEYDLFHKYATGIQKSEEDREAARTNARNFEEAIPKVLDAVTVQRSTVYRLLQMVQYVSGGLLLLTLAFLAFQLLRTKRSTDITLAERLAAQKKAEAENDQLNNSVISILESVNQLSQRDLTAKAPVTQDVIGTVSDSINLLTDETSKVLRGVTHIAGQVQSVSAKVKMQADQVSRTAEAERQNVQQMMESLFDATQTMNQVAGLAEQSNLSAEQATTVTDNALETVNGTVKGMESIRETIAETEKRIKRLGERSQEITGIVNLINTISERTHVLALNASMQAAVAGEAGRGFAVVAEEVQRLAESSRNATQQIASLVNNIQIETNETINTVNRTIGQVVQGSEQAQRAGEQMRRTQEITSQLVSQVRSIANASEQQKAMSAQLLTAVQRIGESTEQTAQQIDAQNQETDTLLSAARRLVESVGVFKLPNAA